MSGQAVIVAGGGTGGHLVPALALAGAIAARGKRPILVSGDRAIEDRVLAASHCERRVLRARGYATSGWRGRLAAVLALPGAIVLAWRWLRELKPWAVVLIGGYVAFPVGVAAVLRRRPLVLVEPNAIPGRTTRLLAPFARVIVLLDRAMVLRSRAERVVGVPVRDDIRRLAERAEPGTDSTPRLLVVGGSQGAATLNAGVAAALPAGVALRVHHASGPGRVAATQAAYAAAGREATVVEYIDDMAGAYADCDFVIGRAGAGTVAELMAAAVPAILVPYPHAADDHQSRNAAIFVAAGGGLVVSEGEGFPERLQAGVRHMLDAGRCGQHRAALRARHDDFAPASLWQAVEARV